MYCLWEQNLICICFYALITIFISVSAMMNQQLYYQQKLQFEIDSWDLSVALSEEPKTIVIDARSPEAYQKEHIPGAINIPHRTMNQSSTSHLDRDALYVVYCDGIGCNASTKGALNMTILGFNVKELIGGLDWWKRDGHQTESGGFSGKDPIACGC
jgi:rhodanese-related sulfurtransferase